MISPIDSPHGQSGFSESYANIDVLATQVLFVMKISPYALKITQITIMFRLFTNLISIRIMMNIGLHYININSRFLISGYVGLT